MQIQVGIITISDRASAGDYKDLGGPALREAAQKAGWQVLAEAIVPDDTTRIQETIRSFSQQGCGVILATGGTGIGPRDVTPEGGNSRDHACRVAWLRRGDARRVDEDHAQFNSVTQPGGDCRSCSGDRASRKTERRRGMSRLRAGRNPAWSRARPRDADFVLMKRRRGMSVGINQQSH